MIFRSFRNADGRLGEPSLPSDIQGRVVRKAFGTATVATDATLRLTVDPSPVVWAYASGSGFKPFGHARFEATGPLRATTVDFVMTWR